MYFRFLLPVFCFLTLLGCDTPASVQSGFVEHADNRIYYEYHPASGPTVVLVHAGGLDHQMWADQVDGLGETFSLLTYDLRGHGQSERTSNEAYEVDDLKAILDHLNLDQVHLVGCSLGGVVALDFAFSYPARVGKLVLVSPGVMGGGAKDAAYVEIINSYVQAAKENNQEGIATNLLRLTLYGNRMANEVDPEVQAYVEETLRAYVAVDGFRRPPRIREIAPMGSLYKIDMPVLLLIGAEDMSYNRMNAMNYLNGLGEVRLEEIQGAGHLVNMEQPEIFNDWIKQFLGDEYE
jgi:3-oxoadipate enol-lactonase